MPARGASTTFYVDLSDSSGTMTPVVGKDYDTFKVVASDMKVGGQEAQMTSWFSEGVGMVKQTFSLPGAGVDVTLELEKFTAGK